MASFNSYPRQDAFETTLTTYTASLWIKRVSTTGYIEIINPTDTIYGVVRVDLSLLPDEWVRVDTTKTSGAVTVVTPFKTSNTYRGGILVRADAERSFYAFGTQCVAANWAGNYQKTTGTTITNPIHNIVKKQNITCYK